MTDKQYEACVKVGVAIAHTAIWLAMLAWSMWMEWHGQHEHAVWVLLLVIAHSLCWLKSIEHNTNRIPRRQ